MSIKGKLDLNLSGLNAVKSAARSRSITLKSVKAGAKVIAPAVKAGAQRRSGALKQSIGIKTAKGRRTKTAAYAVVGARTKVRKMVKRSRRGAKVLAVPAFYAHLVEGGTKAHARPNLETGTAGHHPGSRPKPFLKPAFDANKGKALDAAREAAADEIAKAIRSQAAKLKG